MEVTDRYDLLIVGAGVSGAAQFFSSAKYSNIKKVLLVEKESAPGMINSAPTNNSQTLHEGDIETNYDVAKARSVQHKAWFTRQYLEQNHPDAHGTLYLKGPKMVLGVGSKEQAFLDERYHHFAPLYPSLERITTAELAKREPYLTAGRKLGEKLTALYNRDGITVDYAKLAETLIDDGQALFSAETNRNGEVWYDASVHDVVPIEDGYRVVVNGQTVTTKYLSICAGAHSMYFAKKLQIDGIESTSLLLVAGNFYYTPKYLTAKVYTLQNPKLPFAAVHGDPDILNQDAKTRYGPTTRMVLQLERGRFSTTFEYLRTLSPFVGSVFAYMRILLDKEFFFYALKHNLLFLLPGVGNYLFTQEIRKIIPQIKTSEVKRARGQGGVRPQIVNTKKSNPLNLGEAKVEGQNSSFNITPSPGASTCIYNGLHDIKHIARKLNFEFYDAKLEQDFGRPLKLKET